MKRIAGLLLLFVLVPACGRTAPVFCCRYPIRSFAGGNANLTLLFSWWTNQPATPRPLGAWKRVVGVKTGETERAWVVNARVYKTPGSSVSARIVLENPPIAEERQFEALTNQIAAYQAALDRDRSARAAASKARQENEAIVRRLRRSRFKYDLVVRHNWGAALDAARMTNDLTREKQAQESLNALEQSLKAIPNANGHYQVDCFALDTGRVRDGMPVYDMGAVPSPR
ncbi:MAG: hypothetical protein KGJ88_12930 [Verrucomicrobiota bacterium]|nr:hypothetical protein [Verrucomicrobiota bacterium]